MTLETLAAGGAKWLWDQYGKSISDKALGKVRERWAEFRWLEAEAKYRARLYEQHSTTRLLGYPKPIKIADIFTDVYILDKPTALQRFDYSALQARPLEREAIYLENKRRPALRLFVTKKRLYILGKPGSGKTSLLKYLTLQACLGKIPKTPIFISLKELADSGLEFLPFLVREFEICAFPDALTFIEHLLERGSALLLLDGLDEVNEEGAQRARMISTIVDFSKRYPETQMCLTCRIAATDYSFDQFDYVEIADFDEKQIQQFASKWYEGDPFRYGRLIQEFEKPENRALREFARTPLLLALLCLAFDETLSFPSRRVDLYKEALDALLKKWDASRAIHRDEVYHRLSPGRKEQLFARVAAQSFEDGSYIIRKDVLVRQITQFLQQHVGDKDADISHGEVVLKAIEAQHGILVERAHNLYSFLHLTFQEYFTARYVVDNASNGTITRLVRNHFADARWWEVFLLTASLLDNADGFFEEIVGATTKFVENNEALADLVTWANKKASTSRKPGINARILCFLIAVACIRSIDQDIGNTLTTFTDRVRDFAYRVTGIPTLRGYFTRVHILDDAEKLAEFAWVELEKQELNQKWNLDRSQLEVIERYSRANMLLYECLALATTTNRKSIEEKILAWPMM